MSFTLKYCDTKLTLKDENTRTLLVKINLDNCNFGFFPVFSLCTVLVAFKGTTIINF